MQPNIQIYGKARYSKQRSYSKRTTGAEARMWKPWLRRKVCSHLHAMKYSLINKNWIQQNEMKFLICTVRNS